MTLLLEVGAILLGLVAIALLFALDRPENLGRVSAGWLRRDREGRL